MPKIVGASLAEHREQVRARLFAALASLMAESGFDSVSLADIAARAGVGRTAVYNHFPDKEALLLAFIDDETSSYVATLEDALDGVEDPEQQLRVYIRQQIRLRRTYHLAPGPDLRSVVSPATLDRLRDHADQVERILRRILTAGVDSGRLPEQDLDTVVPLVNACLKARSTADAGVPREAAVEATEEFVLRAVGAVAALEPVG
jgi:AcrR family transcriptional regulator